MIKRKKKKNGLLGLQRCFLHDSHATYFSHSFTESHTHSIFLHSLCPHVNCFFFLSRVEYFSTCNSVVTTNKSPLEKVKSYTESQFPSHQPPINLLLSLPPINMNVTCILCIDTIEIQHISPLRFTSSL